MNQLLKFSLSVQTNLIDVGVNYSVTPASKSWTAGGLDWHEWEYDPRKTLVVQINLDKPVNTKSNIIIANLTIAGDQIKQLDQTGTYYRSDTGELVIDAHGFMSWPGTYTFKILYGPLIHNYISYLKQMARTWHTESQ